MLVVAATERELGARTAVRHVLLRDRSGGGGGAHGAGARERQPDAVLHIGIAGARAIEPLSLVLGSEAVYEDARGPLVARASSPTQRCSSDARRATRAHVLPIGTSAHVGGTSACEVEAMEGFAVLRACALAGVPAVELRAISNAIDEPDRAKWRFDEALRAARASARSTRRRLGTGRCRAAAARRRRRT